MSKCGRTYTPLLEDVGTYLALYWLPTRSDGSCGKPLVAICDSPVAAGIMKSKSCVIVRRKFLWVLDNKDLFFSTDFLYAFVIFSPKQLIMLLLFDLAEITSFLYLMGWHLNYHHHARFSICIISLPKSFQALFLFISFGFDIQHIGLLNVV